MPGSSDSTTPIIGLVVGVFLLIIGAIVGDAIFSAFQPELDRSLEIIAPGYGVAILAALIIFSSAGLGLGVLATFRKASGCA